SFWSDRIVLDFSDPRDMTDGLPAPRSGPAYVVRTPRLVVRCWAPEDGASLAAAIDASLPELRIWMPWALAHPTPVSEQSVYPRRCRGQFDLDQDYAYGIFATDGTTVVGGSGLHLRVGPDAREIGYWIATPHTGRGYATEIVLALTKVAFLVDGVERIEIKVAVGNDASNAVARKAGFRHEAILAARCEMPGGGKSDAHQWVLLRSGFAATPAAELPIEAFDAAGRQLL
ncbi:MAG: GNAT family N-acetyltransferase, partial [Phycisphaerales bacterium]|nr:GNAT family N-acetyltransferase [Phycisphaerales bacterium]